MSSKIRITAFRNPVIALFVEPDGVASFHGDKSPDHTLFHQGGRITADGKTYVLRITRQR